MIRGEEERNIERREVFDSSWWQTMLALQRTIPGYRYLALLLCYTYRLLTPTRVSVIIHLVHYCLFLLLLKSVRLAKGYIRNSQQK